MNRVDGARRYEQQLLESIKAVETGRESARPSASLSDVKEPLLPDGPDLLYFLERLEGLAVSQGLRQLPFTMKIPSNTQEEIDGKREIAGEHLLDFHPEYPGGIWTTSLRGAAASGNNTGTQATGEDVVSNIARHYYEFSSSEAVLQDYYVSLRLTLPEDFDGWAVSNALQVEYKTESATSVNCQVDVLVYQSGDATLVSSDLSNASTTWDTITIDDSALDSAHVWYAGSIIELYLKLESKNGNYARVGKVRLNFIS